MFTSTFLLDTKKNNVETYLNKVFFVAFLMKNCMVKEAKKRLSKLKSDKEYLDALSEYGKEKSKTIPNKDRLNTLKQLLNEKISFYSLYKGSFYSFLSVQQKKYSRYISSQMANAIADDILSAVKKILYSDGKELHFKKFADVHTVMSKSLVNGIRVEEVNGKLYIVFHINRKNKLYIPVIVKDYDTYGKTVIKEMLTKDKDGKIPLRFATLKRRMFSSGYRYYIEFTMKGKPPLKHSKGIGDGGVDIGVSSVAVTTDNNCILEDLAPKIKEYNDKIIRIQKMMERSLRLNNMDCYEKDGTIKKGATFQKTKNYKKLYKRYLSLCRKRKSYIDQTHCNLANRIVEDCNRIFYEEMNFKSLQRRSKKTERSDKVSDIKNKNGTTKKVKKFKRKKRFGKTLQSKAPSHFLTVLKQKCDFYGISIIPIDTKQFKASQYNHETDTYNKKELKDRWNTFSNDILIQRDLYSAYLIKNTKADHKTPNRKKCIKGFETFCKLHDECIKRVKQTNKERPSCFGF